MARIPDPISLDCASEFTHARELGDATFIVEMLKQQFHLWTMLERKAKTLRSRYGPKRQKGSWVLAYLHFRLSKKDDIEPWWCDVQRRLDLWRVFGFDHVPAYQTTWERFAELEGIEDAFEEAAFELIRRAKTVDPNIGVHIHIDGTQSETDAYLFHACTDKECPSFQKHGKRVAFKRLSTDAAIARKHKETRDELDVIATELDIDLAAEAAAQAAEVAPTRAEPEEFDPFAPDDEEDSGVSRFDPVEKERLLVAALMRTVIGEEDITDTLASEEKGPGRVIELDRGPGKRKLYRLFREEHIWLTFDKTAGMKFYEDKNEFWHGYINVKAIDGYTRAPIAARVYNASRAEHQVYEDMFSRVRRALGDPVSGDERLPATVTGDSGYAYKDVFELNTRSGVASVFVLRAYNGKTEHKDREGYDRDQIPRCDGCSGVTRFVRFSKGDPQAEDPEDRSPRLWVECIHPTPICPPGHQTKSCSEDWRYLVPLWPNEELYHHLMVAHMNIGEAVHDRWRSRYSVAAKNAQQRPKRTGIGWQQLASSAGLLAEWLSLSYLNGWLVNSTRVFRRQINPRVLARKQRVFAKNVADRVARWRKRRAIEGLNEPYGERAAELFGEPFRLPPSDRGDPGGRDGPKRRKRRKAEKKSS